MAREESSKDAARRKFLKLGGGLGLASLLGMPVSATSSHDDRETLNQQFETLMDTHGSPTVVGRKRLVNGRLAVDTGGPKNPSRSLAAAKGKLASAETIRFGGTLERDVCIASRGNGVFFVELEGTLYRLHITPADERKIAEKLAKVDAAMNEEIRQKAAERFARKSTEEAN